MTFKDKQETFLQKILDITLDMASATQGPHSVQVVGIGPRVRVAHGALPGVRPART